MRSNSEEPAAEALLKMLEIQWQDHFQTRTQTWRALEITAIIAVALVGLDWKVGNPLITIVSASLLIMVTQFGIQITLRHRKVEETKFRIIASVEKQLNIADTDVRLPEPISWWSIFKVWKSNTLLFILRMHFVIQLFAICYLILRVFDLWKS
ncbi:MAG: hypothetical protein HUU32_10550 [Calditrichaceae bacterium]|nr:hypothetical protein [Calditrichia bacterium]NUQ41823.1 hypothetical protein [Calditrichaceae bacterium]